MYNNDIQTLISYAQDEMRNKEFAAKNAVIYDMDKYSQLVRELGLLRDIYKILTKEQLHGYYKD